LGEIGRMDGGGAVVNLKERFKNLNRQGRPKRKTHNQDICWDIHGGIDKVLHAKPKLALRGLNSHLDLSRQREELAVGEDEIQCAVMNAFSQNHAQRITGAKGTRDRLRFWARNLRFDTRVTSPDVPISGVSGKKNLP
jgi:hypothetical protein